MDHATLQATAAELHGLLVQHAGEDHAIDTLHEMLRPMLLAAEAGQITTPVPWVDVPGDRPFLEGDYAAFPDVEDAYSRFKLLVTGSEDLMRKR